MQKICCGFCHKQLSLTADDEYAKEARATGWLYLHLHLGDRRVDTVDGLPSVAYAWVCQPCQKANVELIQLVDSFIRRQKEPA